MLLYDLLELSLSLYLSSSLPESLSLLNKTVLLERSFVKDSFFNTSLSSLLYTCVVKSEVQSLPSVANRLSTALYILILEYVLFFFIPIFSRRIL